MRELFQELGFLKLIADLDRQEEGPPLTAAVPAEEPPRGHLVRNQQELESLAAGLEGEERIALVPLFTEPLPMRAALVGLGLAAGRLPTA